MGTHSSSFGLLLLEQHPPPSSAPSTDPEEALSKDRQHLRRPHMPVDLMEFGSDSASRAILVEMVLKDFKKEEQHRVFPQAPIPSSIEVYSRGLICLSSTRPRYFP